MGAILSTVFTWIQNNPIFSSGIGAVLLTIFATVANEKAWCLFWKGIGAGLSKTLKKFFKSFGERIESWIQRRIHLAEVSFQEGCDSDDATGTTEEKPIEPKPTSKKKANINLVG